MKIEMPMNALLSSLEKCRAEVVGPGKRRALRAGARVVKKAMEQRAPVLTKKTAGSNALEPGTLKDGMRIYVRNDEGDPEALVGPAAKVEHVARWVEFGHRMVSGGYSKVMPGGKTRGPGKAAEDDVQAHPFLRPAYEESIEAAVEAEKVSLTETIKRQVG